MRVELRVFKQDDGTAITKVLLLCESQHESKVIDRLGDKFDVDGKGPSVRGEVRLADGFREHYILLEKV